MIIGDVLRRNAKLYPSKIGLKFEDRSYTYFEFNERVNRLANGLLDLGLTKGDRVGVLERNCAEFIEAYFAIAKSGTVVVPINPRHSKDEFAFLMEDAGITVLITDGEFIESIGSWRDQLKQLEHIIVLGDMDFNELISYEKFISRMPADEPSTTVTENDPLGQCLWAFRQKLTTTLNPADEENHGEHTLCDGCGPIYCRASRSVD